MFDVFQKASTSLQRNTTNIVDLMLRQCFLQRQILVRLIALGKGRVYGGGGVSTTHTASHSVRMCLNAFKTLADATAVAFTCSCSELLRFSSRHHHLSFQSCGDASPRDAKVSSHKKSVKRVSALLCHAQMSDSWCKDKGDYCEMSNEAILYAKATNVEVFEWKCIVSKMAKV